MCNNNAALYFYLFSKSFVIVRFCVKICFRVFQIDETDDDGAGKENVFSTDSMYL